MACRSAAAPGRGRPPGIAMPEALGMGPFLTFTNPALEASYVAYAARVTNIGIDAWFMCFTAVSRGITLWKNGDDLVWPSYLYLVWLAGEALLRGRWTIQRLVRWREPLVVASRLLHTLEFGRLSSGTLSTVLASAGPDNPLRSFFLCVIFLGAVPMTFLGLFQPLRFRLHLPLHLLSSAFIMTNANITVCGLTGGMAIGGTEWLVEGWDALAKRVLGAAMAADVGVDPAWRVDFPCLQQALVVQVFFGCGAVSYAVWMFERNSRVAFVESLPRAERPCGGVDDLRRSAVFMHAVVMLVAACIFYRVFLNFAPGLIGWGLCGAAGSAGATHEVCARLAAESAP